MFTIICRVIHDMWQQILYNRLIKKQYYSLLTHFLNFIIRILCITMKTRFVQIIYFQVYFFVNLKKNCSMFHINSSSLDKLMP